MVGNGSSGGPHGMHSVTSKGLGHSVDQRYTCDHDKVMTVSGGVLYSERTLFEIPWGTNQEGRV